jgi:hypothetical protein
MKKLGYLLTGVVLGATLFGGAQAAADGILAQRSSAPFFLNGSPVEVETYLIHNNHFFMLRDIAKLVDFGVTWNAESGTVSIDTMTGYDGEYKAATATDAQTRETTPEAAPAYHEQANAAVFDGVYIREAYDALRECMGEGKSTEISMSADTRTAIQGVCAAIGTYPSYELSTAADGKAHFQRKQSSAYADAAAICQRFLATLNGKSESEKLDAIACYVCARLDYDANSTSTPRALFADSSVKKGNCMSFAHGFQFLCDLADIPCVFVHSDIHQWNEVYTGGRWYCVDLTDYEIGYTERGSDRLLHDASELQGSVFRQTEPHLTQFAKELLVPNSTK